MIEYAVYVVGGCFFATMTVLVADIPSYRAMFSIPKNICLDCGTDLNTEDEYKSHIGEFPRHRIAPKP